MPDHPNPTTPLNEDDFVHVGGERETLESFLNFYRAILARKLEGLTDEQARSTPCPPSDLSVMGLVRHMAEVERVWARREFLGEPGNPIFYGDAHPDGDIDGDFHPDASATVADTLRVYWREIAAADAVYQTAGLDDLTKTDRETHNLRWILIHMIEEYARHCGHADLIRQAIDGVTGD